MNSLPGSVAGCERSSGQNTSAVKGFSVRGYRNTFLLPWRIRLKTLMPSNLWSGESGSERGLREPFERGWSLLKCREDPSEVDFTAL